MPPTSQIHLCPAPTPTSQSYESHRKQPKKLNLISLSHYHEEACIPDPEGNMQAFHRHWVEKGALTSTEHLVGAGIFLRDLCLLIH